jgi:hypothetical protein
MPLGTNIHAEDCRSWGAFCAPLSTHDFNPRFACLSGFSKEFGGHLESLKLLRLQQMAALDRLASAVQPVSGYHIFNSSVLPPPVLFTNARLSPSARRLSESHFLECPYT